jgi:ATP-binding cassette subfamily B protein
MSRIVNDLREISELAHHGPEDLFLSLVMLIGSFIILTN